MRVSRSCKPLLLAAVALMGWSAAPAFADCASSAREIEPSISEVGNQAKKEKAQRAISLAVEESEKNNEKACMKYLAEAKRTAGVKTASAE